MNIFMPEVNLFSHLSKYLQIPGHCSRNQIYICLVSLMVKGNPVFSPVLGYSVPHTMRLWVLTSYFLCIREKGKLIIGKKNHLGSVSRHFLSYSKRMR